MQVVRQSISNLAGGEVKLTVLWVAVNSGLNVPFSSGDLYFVEYLIAQSRSIENCNDKLRSINRQRGLLNDCFLI